MKFIRTTCFLLCVGLVQISAFPQPQDVKEDEPISTEDPLVPAEAEDSTAVEALPVQDPESNDNPVTDTPNLEDENQETNKDQESDTDEPNPETNDSSSDNDSDNETADETPRESNDTEAENQGLSTLEVLPGLYVSEVETGSGAEDANPEHQPSDEAGSSDESGSAAEAGSADEEGSTDEPGSVDESGSDGKSKSDDESGNDDNDIPIAVLTNFYLNELQLRVTEEERGAEKIICQMLVGVNEEIIDKECIALSTPHIVKMDHKLINTVNHPLERYTCQEIVTVLYGTAQQLCVTHDGWIFNPVTFHSNLVPAW